MVAVAVSGLAVIPPVQALDPLVVEINRRPTVAPGLRQLEMSGIWPDRCVPQLEFQRVVDGELQLFSRTPVRGTGDPACDPEPTPFRLGAELRMSQVSRLALFVAGESAYELHAIHLLPGTDEQALGLVESGWWWAEAGGLFDSGGPGTGMTIDHQAGKVTLLTHFYAEDGAPEWQMGAGEIRNGRLWAPLVRFRDGQTLTGSYRAPRLGDSREEVHIRFHSPITASAWLTRRSGNSLADPITARPVSLVRYAVNGPLLEEVLLGVFTLLYPDHGQPPRQMAISRLQWSDSGQLLLLNDEGVELGRCDADRLQPERPPVVCALEPADGVAIVLDQFGLERSAGTDLTGNPVLMIRTAAAESN